MQAVAHGNVRKKGLSKRKAAEFVAGQSYKSLPKKVKKAENGMAVVEPTKKGQKPIHFQAGGEHKSLGVPAGKDIPAGKAAAARAGKFGAKAQKQELFRENVLTGPKKAAKGAVVGHMHKMSDGHMMSDAEMKKMMKNHPAGKNSHEMIKAGMAKAGM